MEVGTLQNRRACGGLTGTMRTVRRQGDGRRRERGWRQLVRRGRGEGQGGRGGDREGGGDLGPHQRRQHEQGEQGKKVPHVEE